MNRARQWGTLAGVVAVLGSATAAQQVADPGFNPVIERPAYPADQGPRVAIDEVHLNFHTAGGGYAPFAGLLRLDGYRVQSNHAPFTAAALAQANVLVVANAMHEQSEADWAPLPTLSAFTDLEVAAVETWVRSGGSLLLIADHMPLVLAPGSRLLLPEVAFQFAERTPRIPAVHLLQGAIVYHGRGRVAVLGEAAMLTAQLAGPGKRPVGMNAPEARENARFALNLLHWLSGLLE